MRTRVRASFGHLANGIGVLVRPRRRRNEPGQVTVIVAASMVVIVGMVGLVVDAGYAWGKQRDTQNAADAVAEAGAVVLAQRLAGVVPTPTDADVEAAVLTAGSRNHINPPEAWYTDIHGSLLNDAGAAVGSRSGATRVGDGLIPPGAAGVEASGSQSFPTFMVRILGIDQMTATATATAVAGYATEVCPAEAGCDILPITFPTTGLGCDGQNKPAPLVPTVYWVPTTTPITIPLCMGGPGNVGWLDWTPTNGGTVELVQSIRYPDNDRMTIPDWFYVTSTGNVNSVEVELAINERWGGEIGLMPFFDLTCDAQPTGPNLDDCPEPNVGGQGQQQWYHLPQFAAFQLCGGEPNWCDGSGGAPAFEKGAYITGMNPICDTGNGATSCLAGRFVNIIGGPYSVGPGTGVVQETNVIGVQLIR